MDILELIEEKYPLKPTRWKQKSEVLESDSGTKCVRYWSDETLMNWHFTWRERLESDWILTDRMIRTRDGNWFQSFENGFITLHDERYEPYPKQNHEQTWGTLLGNLLSFGVEQSSDLPTRSSTPNEHINYMDDFERPDLNLPVLQRSLPEAKRRVQTAESIRERYDNVRMPLLETSLHANQGKKVHERLFWQGGIVHPEASLGGIGVFLSDWHLSTNTASLHKLLDAINDCFLLREGYDQLIVAELIQPKEVQRCIKLLDGSNMNQTKDIVVSLEREWEANRKLVEAVYSWIDHSKKVTQ